MSDPTGPTTTLRAAFEEYLRALTEASYSPETIAANRWRLSKFASWAEARGVLRLEQLRPRELIDFQSELATHLGRNGRPMLISVQRMALGIVTNALKWLHAHSNELDASLVELLQPRGRRSHSIPRDGVATEPPPEPEAPKSLGALVQKYATWLAAVGRAPLGIRSVIGALRRFVHYSKAKWDRARA